MQKLYNILSIVILFALCFIIFRTCESKENAEKINEQNKDSLVAWRDKSGIEHSKISVLEGSVGDLKKLNSQKDSSLRKLQALVGKNTTSAIVLNTATTIKGSGKTTVTSPGEHQIIFDTVSLGDCPPRNPTYSTTINDAWLKGTIIATPDSFKYDLKSFNEFDIVETRKREKFWKEKTLKIEITNKNKNTETTGLKAWTEAHPKVRRGFIFVGGVIAGSAGTILGAQGLKAILLK